MTKSEVIISLTKEEAVILSDWLYRNSRKNEYFADLANSLLEKNLDVQDTSPKAVEEAKQQIISE